MVEHYNATILGQWQEATSSFWELNLSGSRVQALAGSVAKNLLGPGVEIEQIQCPLFWASNVSVSLMVGFNVAQVDRRTNRILFSPPLAFLLGI